MDMAGIRARVLAWSGWRGRGLLFLLGAFAALAFPPTYVVPALIPGFVALVWTIGASRTRRAAFMAGWWFGFGHFAVGLHWVSLSMLVEPERYGWMIPFAVLGLGAGFGLFPAFAALLARMIPARGWGAVMVFAASWSLMEWTRGWVLTGFPWNLIGTAWAFSDAMIQFAALGGVWGLSLVTVAALASPAAVPDNVRGGWRPVWIGLAVLTLMWAGGAARLAGAHDGTVEGARLRLVQPAIPQERKWEPGLRFEHVLTQVRMSAEAPEEGRPAPTHVIWGETMTPGVLERESRLRLAVAAAAPSGGVAITGAIALENPRTPERKLWNSLYAVDPKGAIAARYDKHHLVPFGEYVPLRGILKMTKMVVGPGDYSAGPGPRTLRLPGLPPVSPLICYEVIFPGQVSDPDDPPQWLLNLTNDAWFGESTGPYQHMAAARIRAVEEGLPLVRVANTGISAVVDAWGRVVASIGLMEKGVVDAPLPTPAGTTAFALFGGLAFLLALALIFTYELVLGIHGNRQKATLSPP